MTFIDMLILTTLMLFLAIGLAGGIVQAFGSLIGLFLGVFLASNYFENLSEYLVWIFNNENLAMVIAFILILFIVTRMVGFVFYILDKVFKVVTSLPFLKNINTAAGGIVGMVEGVIMIGAFVFIISKYPLGINLDLAISGSFLGTPMLSVFEFFVRLMPEAMKNMNLLLSIQ